MAIAGEYDKPNANRFARNGRLGKSLNAAPGLVQPEKKSWFLVWMIVVFVLIIQQGAFIGIPALSSLNSDSGSTDTNFLNTIGIAISFAIMGFLVFLNAQKIGYLASKNWICLLYMALVLTSAAWSIHPELTIRRGVGYILSMSIAAYLTVGFNDVNRMKLISSSFAISAIGSFLYVAAYPSDGIMQTQELVGTWRGIFPHKNVLGPVMGFAVFTELYVLVATGGRARWRFFLLALYFALLILTYSATAIFASIGYLIATGVYLLWRNDRLLGTVIGMIVLLLVLIASSVLWVEPGYTLGLFGKDTGLSGRTELWAAVTDLIYERPYLGYGYRSMWDPGDTYRILTDELTGGWGVTHSHNALLEITLELGVVGACLIVLYVGLGFWRGLRCCVGGILPLGFFTLIFVVGTVLEGLTEMTIGWNQNIGWLIFNVLMFSCGNSLSLLKVSGSSLHAGKLQRTK